MFCFVFQKGADSPPDPDKSFNEETRKLLKKLPNRCEDAGECSLLRVVASFPARAEFDKKEDWEGDEHPIASLDMEFVKKVTKKLSPLNILKNRESASNARASKRMRDADVVESFEKRKTMREEDSDASESSSGRSTGSQKRERDADDSESDDGREKKRKRKMLDVQVIRQELLDGRGSEARKGKGGRWSFRK